MFTQYVIIKKLNAVNDPFVENVAQRIRTMCSQMKMMPLSQDKYRLLNRETVIFAIGGDGTMLEAMKLSALCGGVAVGINLGRVGFLTDFEATPVTKLIATLAAVLDQTEPSFSEQRTVLSATIDGEYSSELAGNEVTVSQVHADSMITYRLNVNGMDAGVHRANAVIISTATGSTAYSLSAGGALMMPDLASVQITPVAPIMMTSRPLIVPSHQTITVEAWGGPVSARTDGQIMDGIASDRVYTKEQPFKIVVQPYHNKAKILHLEGWNFFEVLSNKLGWQKE